MSRLWAEGGLHVMQELQEFYTDVHSLEGHEPEFPTSYPIGVLIGCVNVVDVLTVGTQSFTCQVCTCQGAWQRVSLISQQHCS